MAAGRLVVGVVGPSGVGKTTLLERLIPALSCRGLAVGAVKHASHGFVADRPGKDSHRLYESGAVAVAVASDDQVAVFVRRAQPAALGAALEALPPGLDVVLVEGFAWERIPRILLLPGAAEPTRDHLAGEVLVMVRLSIRPGERPVFPEDLIASLALTIAERAGGAR